MLGSGTAARARPAVKKWCIVDSTLISTLMSTKSAEKKQDLDAYSAEKGNTWNFGYEAHIGVDKYFGSVHTLAATAANVHDVTMVETTVAKCFVFKYSAIFSYFMSSILSRYLRTCIHSQRCQMDEGFYCQTRQILAVILVCMARKLNKV